MTTPTTKKYPGHLTVEDYGRMEYLDGAQVLIPAEGQLSLFGDGQ